VTIAGSSEFRALGQLTGLQELVVSALRGFRLADVMQLTACKELRYLKLMHMQLTDVLAASLCLSHQVRRTVVGTGVWWQGGMEGGRTCWQPVSESPGVEVFVGQCYLELLRISTTFTLLLLLLLFPTSRAPRSGPPMCGRSCPLLC
jgi:hypothetical protein